MSSTEKKIHHIALHAPNSVSSTLTGAPEVRRSVSTYISSSTAPSQTILVNDIGDQLGLDADEVMQAANAILKKVSHDSSRTTAMLSYLSKKHSLTNTARVITDHGLFSPTESCEHTTDR